jgi:curved DNA-binding protein CbpA
MTDPYAVLGLPADADDEAVRRRYLELVRQYPPEQFAERFAAVRAAYDALRDPDARLRLRVFERGRHETVEAIIEELACRSPRRRLTLEELLAALPKS